MSRLIDAGFTVFAAESEFSEEDAAKVRWLISHIPAVDAEVVRHGQWTFPWTSPECSACRKTQKWTSNYCPNCGAKMGGKEDAAD